MIRMVERKSASIVLPAIVTVLALLGLYVGAYCWMVRPLSLPGPPSPSLVHQQIEFFPVYSRAHLADVDWELHQQLSTLFSPVHWLDRRIRPQVWKPEP